MVIHNRNGLSMKSELAKIIGESIKVPVTVPLLRQSSNLQIQDAIIIKQIAKNRSSATLKSKKVINRYGIRNLGVNFTNPGASRAPFVLSKALIVLSVL